MSAIEMITSIGNCLATGSVLDSSPADGLTAASYAAFCKAMGLSAREIVAMGESFADVAALVKRSPRLSSDDIEAITSQHGGTRAWLACILALLKCIEGDLQTMLFVTGAAAEFLSSGRPALPLKDVEKLNTGKEARVVSSTVVKGVPSNRMIAEQFEPWLVSDAPVVLEGSTALVSRLAARSGMNVLDRRLSVPGKGEIIVSYVPRSNAVRRYFHLSPADFSRLFSVKLRARDDGGFTATPLLFTTTRTEAAKAYCHRLVTS